MRKDDTRRRMKRSTNRISLVCVDVSSTRRGAPELGKYFDPCLGSFAGIVAELCCNRVNIPRRALRLKVYAYSATFASQVAPSRVSRFECLEKQRGGDKESREGKGTPPFILLLRVSLSVTRSRDVSAPIVVPRKKKPANK